MAGGCTTRSVCDKLFDMYISRYRAEAQDIYGNLSCKWAQAVATDMTYNLGPSGMREFVKFIGYMKAGDWTNAALEGPRSSWCGQVKSRCPRNMNQIKNCC